jgi:TRAP-type C4-dicarboxylate transport system substrate-binding protein
MIDTVPASALAAVALQWYTRLKYMAKDNFGVIVGGALLNKAKFEELTEHDQQVLIETSVVAGRANDVLVRKTDKNAYEALVKRGMIEVDTAAYKAEWDAVAKKAREDLVGRVYSKSLLEAVEKIVASN